MNKGKWKFEQLRTFDGYSAEGRIGDNPLFEVMKRADDHFRQSDYLSALQEYSLLIKAEPRNGWLHYRLGHTLQGLKHFDQAIHHYWVAFKLGLPSGMDGDCDALALCDIGAAYAEKGDIEGAIAAFRLSTRIRYSVVASYGLGQVLYLNGEAAAALTELEDAARDSRYQQDAVKLMSLIRLDGQVMEGPRNSPMTGADG